MSQKSNNNFAHGVITIIIQETYDMKMIHSPYGNGEPSQEYQYVDVKILSYNVRQLTLHYTSEII